MNWDFFSRRVCLTLGPEWPTAQAECERVGLTGVQPYYAVKEIGPHQSFSHSERNILLDFLHSDDETLLHLEDDCWFRPFSRPTDDDGNVIDPEPMWPDAQHVEQALSELPSDWDIVYLGANLVLWNNGEPNPERYSEHLFRVKCAWTTHAIGYNKKCVRGILEKQPEFSVQMFDNYLSARLPELNAFCVSPMVARQKEHFSEIWGRIDNYDPIFEASEAKLR